MHACYAKKKKRKKDKRMYYSMHSFPAVLFWQLLHPFFLSPVELKKQSSCLIQLINKSEQHVAFKVQYSKWITQNLFPANTKPFDIVSLIILISSYHKRFFFFKWGSKLRRILKLCFAAIFNIQILFAGKNYISQEVLRATQYWHN